MYCKCKFNPKRDIKRTVVGLDVDLNKAIETGIVSDTGTDVDYSHVEECSEIGTRVEDTFDAIDRIRMFKNKYEKVVATTSSDSEKTE